jgi:excinuclease ABC subunit C
VLESLGLGDTPLVSLAKREEIVFSDRFPDGLRLDRTSPALRLLQNIRDEAHRFAIAFHRRRRAKKSFASLLDGIPGIGPKRKQRLLIRYRSVNAIRSAPQDELASLLGERAAAALRDALAD